MGQFAHSTTIYFSLIGWNSRGGSQDGTLDCDSEVAPYRLHENGENKVRYTYRVMWNVRVSPVAYIVSLTSPSCLGIFNTLGTRFTLKVESAI